MEIGADSTDFRFGGVNTGGDARGNFPARKTGAVSLAPEEFSKAPATTGFDQKTSLAPSWIWRAPVVPSFCPTWETE